ncbi:phosphodiester glycosidase family protein [Borreliella sinica]|uniref:phosphodiester glycosidase family protein n=1 Tax=Borreliella sinica TaxID=87162 RepID=UPI002A247B10|nr:phosphodiester glycosidase family protein [Borreliella sinica]WPM05528.1 phosphodiester glycosidase family protein [Borreliella sinica]
MNKKILTLLILILSIASLMLSKAITKKANYQIIKGYSMNSNYVLVKIENKDLRFTISKPIYDKKLNDYYFKGQTTSNFLISNNVDIAINTSPYEVKQNMFFPKGLYIYNKKMISKQVANYGEIAIKNNKIILNPKEDEIKTSDYGFSGFFVLIKNGDYKKNFKDVKHPRTIIGTDKNNKYLFLVTIEGRGVNNSKGASLNEAIDFALKYGMTNAINLDGGGSSTLVVKSNNAPHKLNFTANIFGQERAVPFHLGIKLPN